MVRLFWFFFKEKQKHFRICSYNFRNESCNFSSIWFSWSCFKIQRFTPLALSIIGSIHTDPDFKFHCRFQSSKRIGIWNWWKYLKDSSMSLPKNYNHQVKVHIFWEGHKILQNLHYRFDWHYIGQIYSEISQNFVTFSEYMNFKSQKQTGHAK